MLTLTGKNHFLQSEEETLRPGDSPKTATILVVDDRPANRAYLVTLLRRSGYRLLQAADGSEALAATRASRPDLVIADILMPTMDGYELVRQMRADPLIIQTPVIFWTAHYLEQQAQSLARKCGVSVVITKPAEPAVVLKAVEVALGIATPAASPAPTEEFDRDHLRLLTDKLAEKVDDLTATNGRLSAMIELNLQLAAEADPRKLLQGLAHAAREIIGARYSVAGIVDGDGSRFQSWFTSGMDAETAADLGSPDPRAALFEEVRKEGHCVRAVNPGGDPIVLGFSARYPAIRAWLGAPISSPARLFGYIGLIDKIGHDEFSAEDERLAGFLAAQVGRIYQNGSQYTEALNHAADLEREIAARARAQERLRQSEAEYRLLFDNNPSPMWVTDAENYAFLAVNDAAIRHYGYSKEEFLTMTARDIRPPDEIPQFTARMEAVRAEEVLFGSEGVFKHRKKDGTVIDVEVAAGPLLFHDRQARLTLAIDVTQRTQLEDQFRQAQQRLRHVVVSSPAVLFTRAIAQGQVAGFRWISDNLFGVFGHLADAAVTPGWWQANVHPDDLEKARTQAETDLFERGRSVEEFRLGRGDGSYTWVRSDMRLIRDEQGRPTEVVGAWTDVTERKRAEDEQSKLREQLEQAEKLESIGQLAGGVAHDFNNLLGVVIGYTEILQDTLPEDSDPRRCAAYVLKAAHRAADLTHQLLAFSRRQVLRPSVFDLTALVAEFEEMLRRLIPANVEIRTVLRSRGQVRADAGQVERVIMNLAVNARDAMPGGGRLTIETADVDLDDAYARCHAAVTPGSYVMLAVSDSGQGMTPEVQARIFDPFYTTKERGKGTGLGLGTVHGIVKQSGGSIYVYSEPGRGSTFKVYLPRSGGVVETGTPRFATQERPRGTETILLTEDELGLRGFVSELLGGLGYTVLQATHGAEALRVSEQHDGPIHLLVTDVVMPGIGGRELAERLAQSRPTMRVLYLSGYTDDGVIAQGVLAHEMAFLQKPFASADLAQKLREILGRGQ